MEQARPGGRDRTIWQTGLAVSQATVGHDKVVGYPCPSLQVIDEASEPRTPRYTHTACQTLHGIQCISPLWNRVTEWKCLALFVTLQSVTARLFTFCFSAPAFATCTTVDHTHKHTHTLAHARALTHTHAHTNSLTHTHTHTHTHLYLQCAQE